VSLNDLVGFQRQRIKELESQLAKASTQVADLKDSVEMLKQMCEDAGAFGTKKKPAPIPESEPIDYSANLSWGI
jgi:uncharacterized coiled-coil protein SlyX